MHGFMASLLTDNSEWASLGGGSQIGGCDLDYRPGIGRLSAQFPPPPELIEPPSLPRDFHQLTNGQGLMGRGAQADRGELGRGALGGGALDVGALGRGEPGRGGVPLGGPARSGAASGREPPPPPPLVPVALDLSCPLLFRKSASLPASPINGKQKVEVMEKRYKRRVTDALAGSERFSNALETCLEAIRPYPDAVDSSGRSRHYLTQTITQCNQLRDNLVQPFLYGAAAVRGESYASCVERFLRPLVRQLPPSSQIFMVDPKVRRKIERMAERKRRERMQSPEMV